jgi:hypothetical protein
VICSKISEVEKNWKSAESKKRTKNKSNFNRNATIASEELLTETFEGVKKVKLSR